MYPLKSSRPVSPGSGLSHGNPGNMPSYAGSASEANRCLWWEGRGGRRRRSKGGQWKTTHSPLSGLWGETKTTTGHLPRSQSRPERDSHSRLGSEKAKDGEMPADGQKAFLLPEGTHYL